MGLRHTAILAAILASVGGGVLEPYLGNIATNVLVHDTVSATGAKWFNSRSVHWARDTVTGLQIAYANWYLNASKVESNTGGIATFRAAIEYPEGTFTQVTWSGGTSVAPASGALSQLSDFCGVSIPDGAKFWVATYGIGGAGAGTPFSQNAALDSANGAAFDFSTTFLADQSMTGGIVNKSGNTLTYTPALIVGMTTKATVFMLGDSRMRGISDVYDGVASDRGEFARTIGPLFGYINAGISGDRATYFLAGNAKRMELAAYCSHIASNLGINDTTAAIAPATTLANLQTIWGMFAGKPVFQGTLPPVATSGNGFIDLPGQTTHAQNGNRITLNTSIRALPAGLTAYFEIADAVESARNSGLWVPLSTLDGTHELIAGAMAIKNAGAVNTSLIVR